MPKPISAELRNLLENAPRYVEVLVPFRCGHRVIACMYLDWLTAANHQRLSVYGAERSCPWCRSLVERLRMDDEPSFDPNVILGWGQHAPL